MEKSDLRPPWRISKADKQDIIVNASAPPEAPMKDTFGSANLGCKDNLP